ncbi:MAG: hypothetical protein JRJ80_20130 [Deltaproteobacteria bacterium]|nr:hypothetical protein [Deltaproteobacteria bacterium]MBW2160146.1 hypothetical protein [Deltaproteobacteria bacterium]
MEHVVRLMGHGSSRMVRRVYAHLDDATFERAIEHLEASVQITYKDRLVRLENYEKKADASEPRSPKNAYQK